MKVLITGVAGFIGHAVAKRLVRLGHHIVGIDNLNNYYETSLKQARLDNLRDCDEIVFIKMDLVDKDSMTKLFQYHQFDIVIHLAAQAGVRYSLENPHAYADTNLIGHLNVLEGCRNTNVKHLVYASSSSIYGMNAKLPFSEADNVDHPVSLYAATKKANELMSHTYSHLYQIPTTGLRFFTVYGPWGRPDMAMFKFTKCVLEGRPIDVYNYGDMSRDFTYIDDIVEGVIRVMHVIPEGNEDWNPIKAKSDGSIAPYALFNIGHGSPVSLMEFIRAVEAATGREAICRYLPMQPGDVQRTWADTEGLHQATGYQPQMGVVEGARLFVEWYRSYYQI
ncbi:NAD-dependent epimerase [Litchfieldella xinjiangensis]|uniref:NAD-dependent epimerase n=1 Tax=Litchfieldella xinjiangensis TaxID=1166948 RepID=UPI0005BAE77C|nr:NAD-dependent epimerase [Halomonas xinjiangensis]